MIDTIRFSTVMRKETALNLSSTYFFPWKVQRGEHSSFVMEEIPHSTFREHIHTPTEGKLMSAVDEFITSSRVKLFARKVNPTFPRRETGSRNLN